MLLMVLHTGMNNVTGVGTLAAATLCWEGKHQACCAAAANTGQLSCHVKDEDMDWDHTSQSWW